jgi:hypothetical protein
MKKSGFYFIVFFILCLFSKTKAQEIVASSGSHFANSEKQISWTLGEPVVTTLSNESLQLTQGFHQSKLIVTALDETSKLKFDITAFPNPASDYLNVKIENVAQQKFHYVLYSMDGRIVSRKQIESSISEIPMYNYVAATYLLKIFDDDNALKTFKIIKK